MSFLPLLRHARRTAVIVSASALSAVALSTVASTPASAVVPRTPKFGTAIENLSSYQPQTKCHPVAQPGVVKFRALILATYKGTGDDGIVRACSSGGTSEHKDGRAWDWAVSYKSAHQVAQVHALFKWLFATDAYGHKYAMARRLGIMYIIWNKHIWGTYAAAQGWRNYSCSGVTLCHQNHVHFSFSKAGASGKTSYWTKVVVNVGGQPGNGDNGGSHGGSGSGSGSGSGTGSGGGTPSPTHDGDNWGTWGQTPGVPVLADSKLPKVVSVPTTDEVRTPYALQAGHHYLVTVTGSYVYRNARTSWSSDDRTPLSADAECVQSLAWSDGDVSTPWSTTPSFGGDWAYVALDLAVDGATTWHPTIDDGQGCNPIDHTYVLHLTPTHTAPLDLDVVGGDHTSGTGTFTVTISRDGV